MWALLWLLHAPPAFSLENEWLAVWRRIEDRNGRPEAEGDLLQWAGDPQYLEYPLDQTQGAFALSDERAWQAATRGARLYVQSISEFTFTNVVELKDAWPVGAGVSVGLRYHQLADRQTQSQLPRLVVAGRDVGGSPLLFELHLFPRWDKEDLDLEAVVGLRAADLGEVRLRALALDPFTNASYALAVGRGAELEAIDHQDDAPLAFALELASARWAGVRGELYGGVLLPATTTRTVPNMPAATRTHTREGLLAGALVEWSGPVTLGATLLHVTARDTERGEGARTAEERLTEARAYALADLPGAVRVESQLRVTSRDFDETAEQPSTLGELRRLWSLRVLWPTEGRVGADLGLVRADRDPRGQVPPWVDTDAAHRLITRVAVRLSSSVSCALGVGWDLDGGDGRYDGGGLTLVATDGGESP